MSSLNGDKIPTENDETFSDYGRKDIYGKQSVNVFEGTWDTCLSILADFLAEDYNGRKTYAAKQRSKQ